ncbi:MAG: histidine phosphatase family protein [Tepidiformaceae bacterium]
MTGRRIILVRHAMPEIERGVASTAWGLSDASREDCVLLAHALPAGLSATVVTSEERKARETADVLALRLGLHVAIDAGFGEVDRPMIWDDDYRTTAAHYLATGDAEGWESRGAVAARFDDAVRRALAATATGTVLVVDHGMALSLWLDSVAAIDLVPFWQALTLPDAWLFDIQSHLLERVWAP